MRILSTLTIVLMAFSATAIAQERTLPREVTPLSEVADSDVK